MFELDFRGTMTGTGGGTLPSSLVVGVLAKWRIDGRWYAFCFDLELDFGNGRNFMEDSFLP
jgi:hypothetical protein